MPAPASLPPRSVAERLRGARLLLTGASGFLGKAVLAAWLRVVDEPGEITLLLRAADDAGARARLSDQVLGSEPLADGRARELVDAGTLRAIAGDLTAGDFERRELPEVDVVVHCAASVSFEQPLDTMLELNALGPRRLVAGLGSGVHVVHVSTAYAAGARTGLVLERPHGHAPGEPPLVLADELAAARAWRGELEAGSREPGHQRRLAAEAREELGPAGALRVGARAEELRHTWVRDELSRRGRERCRTLGYSDAYALSKALGEEQLLAGHNGPISIVRPTIIESALRDPRPGWLEGLKVADPIILAYARGLVTRFVGDPAHHLDLVPVDLVANACVAAAAHPRTDGPRTVAISSSARNPLRVGAIAGAVTEHFRAHPLPDDDGAPVEVDEWILQPFDRALRTLNRAEGILALGRAALDRVALPRADALERRLHRERRSLERMHRLADIYGPYVELDCVFDDREARALAAELDDSDREALSFDAETVDWTAWLREAHLPELSRMVGVPVTARPVLGGRTGRPEAPTQTIPDGPPALALFDVEGVILDATLPHAYAWLRGRAMRHGDRELWLASLAARAPGWLVSDRASRARFNRDFYRAYRHLPAAELREQARAALEEFLLPRIRHAAVRRIRAHRRRGDHVVLITGALDFLVEPLRHLADEVIAARLAESDGTFTGELAQAPLTADGRASLAAARAAEREVDLADCHAYGDAISDLPLLEAVGHPHAVNPDFRLAREARRRWWPVLEWTCEPGARPGLTTGARA